MAQIIQHKRGLLEDLSGVTPNKAELLVVTGSSISALADGLVFVGNSASDITAINRIITGSSTPDVTGGSYNHFIDGVPFYNTTDKKLEILGKSGNTNVVFTANSLDLKGSTIVSGSVLRNLGGTGVLSGSAGVASTTTDTAIDVTADSIVFFDSTDSTIKRDSIDDFLTAIAGTNLSVSSGQLQVAGGGDISGVTAGTGLSGGGESGDVTINFTGNGTGVISGSVLRPNGDGVVSGSATEVRTFLNVEDGADVTDSTNVTAAGALMDSEVNSLSGIKTLTVPDSTTISTFGASLVDDADAGAARTTLGVDAAGTKNSTDVTLAGSYDYITAGGTDNQTLTLGQIDASTDISNLTTANVSEGSNLYYTDARVKTKLNAEAVLSGSVHPGSHTFSNNVTITGDLTVSGTQTIIDSTTVNIADAILNLNYGGGAVNGGLEVTDGTGGGLATGSLLWDGTNDYWKGGAKGSEARIIQEGGSAGTANKVSKFDAAGTIVNSTITDDGTDISITGELTVGGLVADSFVVTNGSKQLLEVTPSTAGDFLQWNGSAFAISNTIDGGSF
jgi:hypothetical protein